MINAHNSSSQSFFDTVKSARDEISLEIHLGTMDLKKEWSELEQRWHGFEANAQLDRSTHSVVAATELLGSELKVAYERLKKALSK